MALRIAHPDGRLDLTDYTGPLFERVGAEGPKGWRVLTWLELEDLFCEALTENEELGEVIIGIQIGDYRRAARACRRIVNGAKP